MENPANSKLRVAQFVLLGIVIGAIPGLIRIDQMRREVQAEKEAMVKEIAILRHSAAQAAERADDEKSKCEAEVSADTARTILVDVNHPYGPPSWNMFGVSMTLPPPSAPSVGVGPIWVIPREVTPQIVDGILAGKYTHVYADGRTDGWQMPMRAQ